MMRSVMGDLPPRIVPPERPLHRLAFVSRFVRNPLAVVPRAAYEEDLVAVPGVPIVWATGPQYVRAVLLEKRERFAKTAQIRLLGPLLGKGILTSEGADWKWQRQASAPMFRPQELAHFVPAFVRASRRLVARWTDNAVRPIERDMTEVTFDVISATLLPSTDASMPAAIEASIASFQRAGGWSRLFAWVGAPRWLPQPGRRGAARAVRTLRGAMHRILAERRASGEAKEDLLGRLMRATDPETGQRMNDEQLADNLLTFYLAGHETTAKALTWTLYLLARYPAWTRRLEAEVDAVAGRGEVSAAHAERMTLVQQVIKESMRLYPPVPLMTRQALADTLLDGHEIRAGTSVVMPIYTIHRHARRWEAPDAFMPERFAPEREAAIPRYQYMPFGAGPRICIGMNFALLEATAILATLLQRVRFARVGRDPVPVGSVTLFPQGGMPLAVRFRP
jgi:cytochrome P450